MKPAGVTPFLRVVFLIMLLFQFPAFVYQFEYDASGEHSSSKFLQLINLGTGVLAASIVFGSSSARMAAGRCWPIWTIVSLAFGSAIWSVDRGATVKASLSLLFCVLFALALTIRFPGFAGLRFVIRGMALGCVLSVVWVLLLPKTGIHQATDLIQNVHAGLWRGIFTHKQGLGTFAGVTFGLLSFYGSMVFPLFVVRVAALACAGACMWGSQSATGAIMGILMSALLFITYWIACLGPAARRILLRSFVIGVAVLLLAFHFGLLSFVPTLFGKSADLTGRGDTWWIIQNNFAGSGRQLLGGGYTSGFATDMSAGFAVDNGYFVKLLEFGYLGCAVLFSTLVWIFVAGVRLLLKTRPETAAFHVFPASIMITLTFYSITETGLMEKGIWTILITIAARIIMEEREVRRIKPSGAGGAPSGRAGRFRGTPRSTSGVIHGRV